MMEKLKHSRIATVIKREEGKSEFRGFMDSADDIAELLKYSLDSKNEEDSNLKICIHCWKIFPKSSKFSKTHKKTVDFLNLFSKFNFEKSEDIKFDTEDIKKFYKEFLDSLMETLTEDEKSHLFKNRFVRRSKAEKIYLKVFACNEDRGCEEEFEEWKEFNSMMRKEDFRSRDRDFNNNHRDRRRDFSPRRNYYDDRGGRSFKRLPYYREGGRSRENFERNIRDRRDNYRSRGSNFRRGGRGGRGGYGFREERKRSQESSRGRWERTSKKENSNDKKSKEKSSWDVTPVEKKVDSNREKIYWSKKDGSDKSSSDRSSSRSRSSSSSSDQSKKSKKDEKSDFENSKIFTPKKKLKTESIEKREEPVQKEPEVVNKDSMSELIQESLKKIESKIEKLGKEIKEEVKSEIQKSKIEILRKFEEMNSQETEKITKKVKELKDEQTLILEKLLTEMKESSSEEFLSKKLKENFEIVNDNLKDIQKEIFKCNSNSAKALLITETFSKTPESKKKIKDIEIKIKD